MQESVTAEPFSQVGRLYRWPKPPSERDCAEVKLASN